MNRKAAIPVAETVEELAPQRRFRPYPEYQASGVEWLAEAPTHWNVRKLKYLASLRFSNVDKKSHDDEPPVRLCNYTDVYYNEHMTSAIAFMDATASTDEIERFSLRRGDVLITKDSEDPNDIAVSTCVVDDLEGVLCGYHLAQVRPHPGTAHGPYLARAFAASGIRDQFNIAATGITRYGLSKDTIGSSLFFVPPLCEQRAIAAFLDWETGRIDEFVAKKQRLIELLAEKRTALISHAVTKGLNPDAPMKDSGIEWLGQVPDHWERQSIGQLCYLGRGKVMSNIYMQDHPGKFPVYSSQTEESGAMGWIDSFMFDGEFLTWTTDGANAGTVFHRRGKFSCTNVCGTLRVKVDVSLEYLHFALAIETRRYVRLDINPKLMNNVMARIPVLVPPQDEQQAIAAFLGRATARVNELVAKVREAIGKLREYRSALISAAVTGKIDVRGPYRGDVA